MKIFIICCVPEKSYSLDIDQNALSQSESGIFKSTLSPDQIDEIASFLAC